MGWVLSQIVGCIYMYIYIYIYVQIESGHPLNIGSNDLGNMFFLKIYQFTF